jgi:hypothetical protein
MASLPQEITRDVLLPWWRAFRTADEEAYLRWMQDYDFDEFYTEYKLFMECLKECTENNDIYDYSTNDHPFYERAFEIYGHMNGYLGKNHPKISEMRDVLDKWMYYKTTVLIPLRNRD